jgi:hypothetical protein
MPDQLAIRYTDRRDLSVTVGPETIADDVRGPLSKIGQRYFDDKTLTSCTSRFALRKLCNPAQCFQTVSALGRCGLHWRSKRPDQEPRGTRAHVPSPRPEMSVIQGNVSGQTVRLVARGLSPLSLHDLPKLGTTMLGPVASGRMRLVVGREVLKPIVDLR